MPALKPQDILQDAEYVDVLLLLVAPKIIDNAAETLSCAEAALANSISGILSVHVELGHILAWVSAQGRLGNGCSSQCFLLEVIRPPR